jgi:tripartite-type tricarboxylate transporter receptor subunit TctC
MATLKNEKPDGHTLGLLITGAIMSQHMRKVPYDTAKDFTPIMQYGVYLYGLVVRPDSPWKTFKEFIAYSKGNPGKIRYSTAGPGTPQHLVWASGHAGKSKWTRLPFEAEEYRLSPRCTGRRGTASQTTEWKKHVVTGTRLLAV